MDGAPVSRRGRLRGALSPSCTAACVGGRRISDIQIEGGDEFERVACGGQATRIPRGTLEGVWFWIHFLGHVRTLDFERVSSTAGEAQGRLTSAALPWRQRIPLRCSVGCEKWQQFRSHSLWAIARTVEARSVAPQVCRVNGLPSHRFGEAGWRHQESPRPHSSLHSSSSGRFSVRLGARGTFRLPALRIGYLPTDTSFSVIRGDEVVTLELILSMRRVTLAPVTITERSRCADASGNDGSLVGIWEQVSATLDATSRSSTHAALAVETISYTSPHSNRDRGPPDPVVESATWRRGGSFQSVEARDLAEHGFLRVHDGELEFLAPDTRVLIDSAFTQTYCLSRRPGPANQMSWQGIGFRHPKPPANLVTVEGVLWVDEEARLQQLDYTYRGLAREVEKIQPGGTIHFLELPPRQWIVARWNVRMAETVIERRTTGVGTGARIESVTGVRGVVEREGVAVRVRIGSNPIVPLDAFPANVRMEGARSASPDVAVWSLERDGHPTLLDQDAQGAFSPSYATPGTNRLLVWTSRMRALGLPPDASLVQLRPIGDSLVGTIRVPDDKALSARLCPATRGAVAVGIRPSDERETLVLSQAQAELRTARRYMLANDDTSSTQWRACGLPRNVSLVLWSERDGIPQVHSRFRIPQGIDIAMISGNSDSRSPRRRRVRRRRQRRSSYFLRATPCHSPA